MADIPLDAVGAQHERADARSRIVSLVPGITESLFALDLDTQVVGRTQQCAHPAGPVNRIPDVGLPKKWNLDKIQDLQPSHVFLGLDENTRMLSQRLKSMVPNIVVTHQMMPRDNLDLFRLLGGIFSKEQKAEAFCTDFEKALRDVSTTSRRMPERRVIMFVSKDPWTCISQNTYTSRVLDLVRWRTVGDDKRVRFPKIKITKSLLSKTDILLFSTSPFRFNQDDILDFIDEYDCASKSVSLIDGEMISWGGNRAIYGLQYLRNFAQELK